MAMSLWGASEAEESIIEEETGEGSSQSRPI